MKVGTESLYGRGRYAMPAQQIRPTKRLNRVRVCVVVEDEASREKIGTVLRRCDRYGVVGQYRSWVLGEVDLGVMKPDVVIVDGVSMFGTDAVAHMRCLLEQRPMKVLVITGVKEPQDLQQMIALGVEGFVSKPIVSAPLLAAMDHLMQDRAYLDPRLTRRVFGMVREHESLKGLVRGLSPQEQRIMPLVADGLTNKDIATSMGLSDKTVKNYLATIFEKLNISSRAQAAAIYVQGTFIPLTRSDRNARGATRAIMTRMRRGGSSEEEKEPRMMDR